MDEVSIFRQIGWRLLRLRGWTMSIKQKQLIEYATQDLVAMVVEREGKSIQDAMGIVYHSRLHDKLQDVDTGLYLEGSEYLYGLLNEERGEGWPRR